MNRCGWCRKSVLIADDKLLLRLVNSDFSGAAQPETVIEGCSALQPFAIRTMTEFSEGRI
jgi:hypothetical protein